MWLILQDQICRENTTWKVWTGRKKKKTEKNKSPFLCIYVNVDVGNQHKNQSISKDYKDKVETFFYFIK